MYNTCSRKKEQALENNYFFVLHMTVFGFTIITTILTVMICLYIGIKYYKYIVHPDGTYRMKFNEKLRKFEIKT